MDLNNIQELKTIARDLNSKFEIDILVNNGGTSMREEFHNLKLQMVTKMMRVNYLSTVALSRYIGKEFSEATGITQFRRGNGQEKQRTDCKRYFSCRVIPSPS